MLGPTESVSLSRHSLLHRLVLLFLVLLAFRVVMVVMIVMMVLPVLLELRLSGIFNLNPRFSGQRLLYLVFAFFFCLFLTFLLGLCISFLATAHYRRWLPCVSPFVWGLRLKALIAWSPHLFYLFVLLVFFWVGTTFRSTARYRRWFPFRFGVHV